MKKIMLAVAGAMGRMGRAVLDGAEGDERFVVAAARDTKGSAGAESIVRVANEPVSCSDGLGVSCDVLIDFTTADGTMEWLERCRHRGIAMVIGTTGHSATQRIEIDKSAKVIPIVRAANFSVGMQVMTGMMGRLVRELGEAYDIEIVETHHRNKVDAPSGTALALLEELWKAGGRSQGEYVVNSRAGKTGVRPAGQIGVHSVRMGDVVGQHEVHFSGAGETITVRHVAHSREAFAAGALRAAAWVVGKPPGCYGMGEVLADGR